MSINPDLRISLRHRRVAYRVRMNRPFRHSEDTDVIDGMFQDPEGVPIGPLIVAESLDTPPDTFLVIPDERIPLIHVEAALDQDHRIGNYEQVVGLIYDASEEPAGTVAADGDRWDGGDIVV